MIAIGCDPGASGAIAWIADGGGVDVYPLSGRTEPEIASTLRDLAQLGASVAVLERVHGGVFGMPAKRERCPACGRPQGRQMPSSAGVTLGRSAGLLAGSLYASGITVHELMPARWQQLAGVPRTKGSTRTERLQAVRLRAQQLYPTVYDVWRERRGRPTNDTAAAVLMARVAMGI